MVAGLKFLSKKSFNPQNNVNRKAVWEAHQRTGAEEKRIKEREDQLRRERDDEELALSRGGAEAAHRTTLTFMYKAPPGLATESSTETNNPTTDISPEPNATETGETTDLTRPQSGDDAAARAFRAMLMGGATEDTATNPNDTGLTSSVVASASEDQKKQPDTRTALEKAVGKKSQTLSLKEQVERFPQLQNAPMVKGLKAAGGADAQGVSFKPLGAQFRNVKCMSCGQWGHTRGDRECPQTGWNPFAASTTSAKQFNATDKPTETTTETKLDNSTNGSNRSDEEDTRNVRRKREKKERKSDKKHRHRSRRDYDDSDRRRRRSRSASSESSSSYYSDDERRHRKSRRRSKRDDSERRKHRKSSHRKSESSKQNRRSPEL
eukprot:CAMPEP_0198297632 /NCGR_PEP_ID=MMETSP1449-20131203/37559_1 /TAXON_ID=420275 /ORGANISM="Attheya septentrionalis, Strain CCMP2084" /LENGTH=378 /DNA_ID=CAMNT_0043998635 /DNA_START=155 /DNA_END=1291 /DNA_ORIENTATION=+